MSYTNQDPSYNTASTGTQGGKYGSNNTDQLDNTNRVTGGSHFGDSGDPNTFSNVGSGNNNNNRSDNQPSDDYGSSNNNQQSSGRNFGVGEDGMGAGTGTGGTGTRSGLGSTVDNNNMGVSGLGGAGNRQAGNVGGPGAYGTAAGTTSTRHNNNNNDNLNSMDDSGNTMAGAGEGFAAGTGTSFANDREDTTARGASTYGNYTGGDANAPPAGFRGGRNDPAYQPGSHYDYKAHGVVPDGSEQHHRRHHNNDENNNDVGDNNTSSTGGRTLPLGNTSGGNDSTYQGSNNNNNNSSGTGTRGEDWQSGATGLSNTEKAAVAGGVGGGALYAGRDRERHGADYGPETGYGPVAGSDVTGSNAGSRTGAGYAGDADAGAPMGGNNNNFDNTQSSNLGGNSNTRSSNLGGGGGVGNTLGSSNNQSSNTGPNLGKPANTSGGGEGWQSGMTGLTEEEVRQVQQGLHSRSAVEAHPNPSQMETYGGVNNNNNL